MNIFIHHLDPNLVLQNLFWFIVFPMVVPQGMIVGNAMNRKGSSQGHLKHFVGFPMTKTTQNSIFLAL
jgi:hypothetical protein